MSSNDPTVSVGALTAKIAQSLANVNKQREAMRQVSEQIRVTPAQQPKEGVSK